MNYEKLQNLTFKMMCMCGFLLILCKFITISIKFNFTLNPSANLHLATNIEPYIAILQQLDRKSVV